MTPDDLVTLRVQLKRDEGLRLLPYLDADKKITIGYGRNLTDTGINQNEAEDLLTQDITRHVADLLGAFPVVARLDSVRQIVLSNMCFNLGIRRLSGFVQMWAAINRSDWAGAASDMLNSDWAQQVGARATRLAASMASGELK